MTTENNPTQCPPNPAHAPKVFSDEEIDMFLAGDRRQIDRHVLYCLNRIAATLISHTDREDKFWDHLDELGGLGAVTGVVQTGNINTGVTSWTGQTYPV